MDSDLITVGAARERLGVSRPKMARLIREGLFPVYINPLDRREKLVRWAEVEEGLRKPIRLESQEQVRGKAVAA